MDTRGNKKSHKDRMLQIIQALEDSAQEGSGNSSVSPQGEDSNRKPSDTD